MPPLPPILPVYAALLGILFFCLSVLTGRVLHAYGVSQTKEPFAFRVSGMAMTFTPMLTASAWLLDQALA